MPIEACLVHSEVLGDGLEWLGWSSLFISLLRTPSVLTNIGVIMICGELQGFAVLF